MHPRRFDALARTLSRSRRTRRRTLLGAGLGLVLAGPYREAAAGCKRVGRKCDKNKDCCDGAKCKGGKKGKCRCKSGLNECPGEKACKNLDTDAGHCGACNAACPAEADVCVAGACAACPAGADHCAAPGGPCQNNPDCFCLRRLSDGAAICAEFPKCKIPCGDDEDCAGIASFCAAIGEANGESCCSVEGGPGRCADRCGA